MFEVAEAVGVSEEAVRSRLREGRLTGRRVRVGRRSMWRADAAAVDAWRMSRRLSVLSEPKQEALFISAAPGVVPGAAEPADREGQRVAVLEAEVARLRRRNEALTVFVRVLLDR